MFFLCIRGYGGQNKFLIEKKKHGRILVLAGKNIGSACFLGALPDRTPHEFDIKWSTFIKYKLNCLYHTGYCLNCIYIFLSAAKGRVEKKWKIPFWWMGGVSKLLIEYWLLGSTFTHHWSKPSTILNFLVIWTKTLNWKPKFHSQPLIVQLSYPSARLSHKCIVAGTLIFFPTRWGTLIFPQP